MRLLKQTRAGRPPARLLARLALAVGVLALPSVGSSPAASAADYEVEVCTLSSPAGDGITTQVEQGSTNLFGQGCGVEVTGGLQQIGLGSMQGQPITGSETWTLRAPSNTKIDTLKANRAFSQLATWNTHVVWELVSGSGPTKHTIEGASSSGVPASGDKTYNVNSTSLTARLFCPVAKCEGGNPFVSIVGLIAALEDETPPTEAAGGPLLAGGPIRGTKEVSFSASDKGSGVAQADLFIDGAVQAGIQDGNGGRCVKPYKFLVPCKPSVNSSFTLDTTKMADGDHEAFVSAEDASGQFTTSVPVKFTVHNAPTNTVRPVLAGSAKVDGFLTATTGSWDGSPTAFAYQWLRCPAGTTTAGDTTGCTPIAAATSPRYVPGSGDVNRRDLVMVTATNSSGSEAATSAPSEPIADPNGGTSGGGTPPPDTTAPVLKHMSLSHPRIRIAKTSTARRHRTLLRFSSSEAGDLTIVIERTRRGRRPRPIATLGATIKAGRSSVVLTGKVGKRQLAPGGYRITISVRDAAGNVSKPARRSFRIVPG